MAGSPENKAVRDALDKILKEKAEQEEKARRQKLEKQEKARLEELLKQRKAQQAQSASTEGSGSVLNRIRGSRRWFLGNGLAKTAVEGAAVFGAGALAESVIRGKVDESIVQQTHDQGVQEGRDLAERERRTVKSGESLLLIPEQKVNPDQSYSLVRVDDGVMDYSFVFDPVALTTIEELLDPREPARPVKKISSNGYPVLDKAEIDPQNVLGNVDPIKPGEIVVGQIASGEPFSASYKKTPESEITKENSLGYIGITKSDTNGTSVTGSNVKNVDLQPTALYLKRMVIVDGENRYVFHPIFNAQLKE